jgi:hypothetical protein
MNPAISMSAPAPPAVVGVGTRGGHPQWALSSPAAEAAEGDALSRHRKEPGVAREGEVVYVPAHVRRPGTVAVSIEEEHPARPGSGGDASPGIRDGNRGYGAPHTHVLWDRAVLPEADDLPAPGPCDRIPPSAVIATSLTMPPVEAAW